MRLKLLSLSVMAMGVVALSDQVLASGYNFGSQSVSAQGTAHANAAEAADPSTIYYNPAGLSELDGTQLQFGLTGVIPNSKYTDQGSRRANPPGLPLSGNANNSSFAPSAVVVPNFYLSHKINDRLTAGIGVFVPYGAKLDYGNNWVGRYALENIDLQSVNFNPTIAFKLDERHSFGLGVSAQYMKATLQKAVDTQGLGTGDGQVKLDANGWGYGLNLGYLFKLDEHTRFGLAYRSRIRTTLSGSANWDFSQSGANPVNMAILNGTHKTGGANTTVDTPDSASASFYRDLNDKIALMGTVTWWGHSAMKNVTVKFDNAGEKPMIIDQSWKNAWTYALGMNYKVNDALLLRTGVAYEQSPVPNDSLRHPALPDSDRTWLSLGANYKFNKNSSLDFAYSYIWFKNANMNYKDQCGPGSTCTGNGETTNGVYKTNIQMIGVAYNYRF